MIPVIIIGVVFLVILIVGHELGHFIAAKLFGLRVDEFGIGFPPRIFARKSGETKYSLNLLPFGGFVKIHGEHARIGEKLEEPERSFVYQPIPKRAVIILAGVLMNFIIGWIALSAVFTIGTPKRILIEGIAADSPAANSELRVGNYIEGYDSVDQFLNFVDSNLEKEIVINNQVLVPRVNPPENEGSLGLTVIETGIEKQPIFESFLSGFRTATELTKIIIQTFARLIGGIFTGDFSIAKQVSGPVGIFNLLKETSSLGFVSLIQFLGFISINLMVINLLPFPALDGGRLLFLIIEGSIRKPLNEKFEIAANMIGLSILLLLMFIVTIRDIIRIF